MRYINKEYGFTFRPPFFDKFSEESHEGPELSAENFPSGYIQGIGYDYGAINGAMLVGKHGTLWGIRVSYYDGSRWLDNDDFVTSMGAGCANTADGSFAHFTDNSISVKWAKHSEQSLVLRLSARKKMRVRVIFYPCYGLSGELSIEGAFVKGRSPYLGVIGGSISLTDSNAVFKDRYLVIADDKKQREYFIAQSYSAPSDSANGAFNEAIMEFVLSRRQPSVYIYAAVGGEELFSAELPRPDKAAKQIETAELRYGVNKTMGIGSLCAPAERMFNSVLWSRIYYPYLLTEIYSPCRTLLNNHFDMKGLEENCSALLGTLTGAEKASLQLKYTAEDRIFALIAVWHTFCHCSDKTEILKLYKTLKKLYPPAAKLIRSGEDKNEVAYKMGDSPLKETFETAPMFSLDLSCFYAYALDVMERLAAYFELDEAEKYKKAKRDMSQLINDTFWNEQAGLYLGRYVNGQWPQFDSYGATSFYPLLAGVVDSAEKLSALVCSLTDTDKFWGEYIVPTLTKQSREYNRTGRPDNNGKRRPKFLEYRGSIVPYVNYIIYHGLVRYGLDELAGQVAAKSVKLWANNESDNVENYSLYLPSGKRYKSKDYLSSSGNMLAMIGIQELIDLEYYRVDLKTAIRFGTFAEGLHSLTNYKLCGKTYSIEANEQCTMLIADNVDVLRGEGGKFVVRNYCEEGGGCEFMIDARANITIHLNLPTGAKKTSVKYFFIVPAGKSRVVAENGMVNIQPIEQTK